MVSTSKAVIPSQEQGVGQGDIFKDVKYSYIDSEDDDSVEVMEFTFPYAIVMSQSGSHWGQAPEIFYKENLKVL